MQSRTIHSTSVVIEDSGVLIVGDSGSGKSDLALRLIVLAQLSFPTMLQYVKKMKNQFFCIPPFKPKDC